MTRPADILIALGANPAHAIKTLVAAESYHGPSLVIAYCHCIGQGIDMKTGMELQKEAVTSLIVIDSLQ